jgi:hypothetical protein
MENKDEIVGRRMGVGDAAKYTGLSVSYLNKLRVSGDGPEYYKLGSAVIYDTGVIDIWMAQNRRRHTADSEASR